MYPKPPASTALLVVDDEKYRQNLLSRWAVKLGHQMVAANNGPEVVVNCTLNQGTTFTGLAPKKSPTLRAAPWPKSSGRFDDAPPQPATPSPSQG